MKKTVSGILFVLLLVSVFTGAFNVQSVRVNASSRGETVQAEDTDWWPMFHHDLNHMGYSTSTAPKTNRILWSYLTGGYVDSSPAVVDGVVYVGSTDSNVYALNASSGAVVWSYMTDGVVESSPAVVDGVVFVGSCDKKVYALNATTGEFVWSYITGGVVDSSPT
ncbi:MAG TPA: PQQ-binding-like beta-propeller repeat protein, partial [Acidobacteriota bacterium]|nr:PQQ-binding-like beta-propeller repeat protein [Acidobacteriota bacterium]